MLSVAEASEIILAGIRRLEPEQVPAAQCAGRVLAQDLFAETSQPPWNNSSMDGYAVRSADVPAASARSPVILTVAGDIPAGGFASAALKAGEAMRIMTGAPLPAGADSVVRLEDTDGGTKSVEIRVVAEAGRNVRYAGEDFKAGTAVISASTPLNSAHLGLAAAVGRTNVPVYRRPRVAVISSGDELVDAGDYSEVRSGKKIVSVNNYTLCDLVRAAGGIPVDLGIAADSVASLAGKLEQARDCDLVITSAGVSVGEKDFTREAVARLGGTQRFWKVKMRPGAPLAFGTVHGKPWLGVSGNPVSAVVSFILFGRPAVRKMLGHTLLFPSTVSARLTEEIVTAAPLTHFLRGILVRDTSGFAAGLSGSQSSGVMTALARANALLVVPEDVRRIEVGGTIRAIPIHEDWFTSETLGI